MAASTLALAACAVDLAAPGGTTLDIGELIVLAQKNTAPDPGSATFYVVNSRAVVRNLVHPDATSTPFVRLQFPAGSLESVSGQPVGASDSVLVTVTPDGSEYGFSVQPSGLRFASGARPTATLFYGFYGDVTVANGTKYTTASDYASALELWQESTIGRWQTTPSSGPSGTDAVAGEVVSGGQFLLAAPR